MIELRSDTFTLPTPEMMAAIADAPLGDDVYGEDPTALRLERMAADMLNKPAACFMPSGTMANLASIMAHCPRGTKALVSGQSDIYIYEAGGASICGGVIYEPVPTQSDGSLALTDLARAIEEDTNDPQFARARLICLELPHNRCGGSVFSLSYLQQVRGFADKKRLAIHLDGARLFNAAIALGVEAAEIVRYANSVQFCLSKGLSAPIGSIVAGSESFVADVRRLRKMLGGGMRQAGIIAAAGIVALERMVSRLAEDHRRARWLAEGLSAIPGLKLETPGTMTNSVLFRVEDERYSWETFIAALHGKGVRISELGYGRLRAVTHAGITDEDIRKTLRVMTELLCGDPVGNKLAYAAKDHNEELR
ncbi:GntG family PLP-dependent aldolase [Gorillibacterium massiliense]|uniref:GntG family PLP-dependent aldolase n=1 Tax=Gorillibacterium massiliense TaxID=1280390 RepID=UPI0004AF7EEC|nr:GntG family PLP-dependent aldolase [Gorillibacterium massiliense]